MVVWITAMMLIIAVALFVAAPLADYIPGDHSASLGPEADGLVRERALAIQALRELEFDYAMGKLDIDDYSALRQSLENRALAAMETPQDPPQLPQLAPAARRKTVVFCPRCGAKFAQTDNSCGNCGAGLTTAESGEIP